MTIATSFSLRLGIAKRVLFESRQFVVLSDFRRSSLASARIRRRARFLAQEYVSNNVNSALLFLGASQRALGPRVFFRLLGIICVHPCRDGVEIALIVRLRTRDEHLGSRPDGA
jgi:hypothetical protein